MLKKVSPSQKAAYLARSETLQLQKKKTRLAVEVVWIVTMKRWVTQHEKTSTWLSISFFCTALFSISTHRTQVKGHLLFLTWFLKRIRLMQSCCLYICHLPHTFAVAFESVLSFQTWFCRVGRNQITETSTFCAGVGCKEKDTCG